MRDRPFLSLNLLNTSSYSISGWVSRAFSFIGLTTIGAIISGVAWAFASWVWPWLGLPSSISYGTLGLGFTIIFTVSLLTVVYFRSMKLLSDNIAQLDEGLFRLLSEIDPTADQGVALKQLVQKFLESSLELLFDKENYRISVFLLETNAENYIRMWCAAEIEEKKFEDNRFYVGDPDPDKPPGVAGRTFRDGETRTVEFTKQKNGNWTPNTLEFHPYGNLKERWYHSFVTVVIKGQDNQTLGVLCLDSKYQKLYWSKILQNSLADVVNRIATVLTIFSIKAQLQNSNSQ